MMMIIALLSVACERARLQLEGQRKITGCDLRLCLSIDRAPQAEQRGLQEVLPDGSGGAQGRGAHLVKRARSGTGPHTG